MPLEVDVADHRYDFVGRWASLPFGEHGQPGWAHHGLAVTAAGHIVGFHTEEPALAIYDREGTLLAVIPVEITEGHGITLVRDGDLEYLWVADNGVKRRVDDVTGAVRVDPGRWGGQVVKIALDGRTLQRLPTPPLDVYETGRYGPSSVAVDEEARGGSGDVWVADGYGQSLLHRFDRNGVHLQTLTGEAGAGRFDCPHGIFLDRRGDAAELYVGDRSNRRVQVFDLEGTYKRSFGQDFLKSPCAFAVAGDLLVITELDARLTICDRNDDLLGYLGEDVHAPGEPGWPNLEFDGRVVPRTRYVPGHFNSPHGVAVDEHGAIYVSEWLLGGRLTKLVPLDRSGALGRGSA